MAEYQFLGETSGIAYEAPGFCVMRKYVDIAQLVLYPERLALASAPNTPLTSFSGFAAADILNVFHLPAGFVARMAGMYIQTADTNATSTIALGIGGATAAFMAATALTPAATLVHTVVGDAYGANSVMAKGFAAADTIDALFAVATAIDAKLHFWVEGYKGFDIAAV